MNVTLANKIYCQDGFQFDSNFKAVQEHYFRSPAQNINFAEKSQSASTINDWVSKKTNGRVQHIVHPGTKSFITM